MKYRSPGLSPRVHLKVSCVSLIGTLRSLVPAGFNQNKMDKFHWKFLSISTFHLLNRLIY